jgi:hypothetical protein
MTHHLLTKLDGHLHRIYGRLRRQMFQKKLPRTSGKKRWLRFDDFYLIGFPSAIHPGQQQQQVLQSHLACDLLGRRRR